ncbi:MAG: sulfatase/phosphatase domain-containing protein, partial [Parvibaculales bacterium]
EEDSIIIFTSDHGFHLGQHELWQKGDLFEGSLHLPLIIKVPGMKRKGEAAKGVVELLDLYPTILEMARIKVPRQSQGKSLLPLLSDPHAEIRKASFSMALGRAGRVHREWAWRHIMGYSIRTGRYRYTEYGENGEWGQELYDYEQDPNEYENRAKEKYSPTWARMRHLLHQRKADAKKEVKGL